MYLLQTTAALERGVCDTKAQLLVLEATVMMSFSIELWLLEEILRRLRTAEMGTVVTSDPIRQTCSCV